jgi:hypothetical protein
MAAAAGDKSIYLSWLSVMRAFSAVLVDLLCVLRPVLAAVTVTVTVTVLDWVISLPRHDTCLSAYLPTCSPT